MTANPTRGMLLALGAACLSGVAVFVNSYGVKHFGDATVYTTAKNGVAGMLLLAVLAPLAARRRHGVRVELSAPTTRGELLGLVALSVVGGSVPFVLFFEGLARISSTQSCGPLRAAAAATWMGV